MGTIITCGVYGFTAETFEKAVVDSRPDAFVDTRRRRSVRGSQYSFANSKRLQAMLEDHDISYVHKIDLAPSQKSVKREGEIDKEHDIARHERESLSDEFIQEYKHDVLDDFNPEEFIESLGDVTRVLIFCVEQTPAACHRGLLAETIVNKLDWERLDLVAE